MSIAREFREFIARGNVIDLAVGVVVGGAFGAIVKSLVDQVVMPPVGLITGRVDFSRLEWVLVRENPATAQVEKVAVAYGAFINTVVQFLIVSAAVFMLVKVVNAIRRDQAAAPKAAPTPSEALLTEIRDLLRAQAGVQPPASPPARRKKA